MDTNTLIKNLNLVFCELSKHERKYPRVWLEEETFGGLYNSGKYILNVQASHEIDNCSSEILFIVNHLSKVASEELKEIFRVAVYDNEMDVHCIEEVNNLLVFDESKACN